jgi:phage tail tape-measure protein
MTPDPQAHSNRDPLTGERGAHPVATGLGASGGALAGAAFGAIGGPFGAAAGAVAGAIAGGLAGSLAGEVVNPSIEEGYWREHYKREPYYNNEAHDFSDYGPAYRMGIEARSRRTDSFDLLEPYLQARWEEVKGSSRLSWEHARQASRAAWERLGRYAD